MKIVRLWSTLALLACLVAACSPKQASEAPDMAFAPYIQAYSGGIVPETGPVRIELAQAVPYELQAEDVFSFSPRVKGSVRWTSPTSVEFIPDEGALKSGDTYQCKFALGQVLNLSDSKLAQFSFPVTVARKQAMIDIQKLTIGEDGSAVVSGSIRLSMALPPDAVQEMIQADCGGTPVKVTVGEGGSVLPFETEAIQRPAKEQTLTIRMQGSGFAEVRPMAVTIPAEGNFRVLYARRLKGADPCVEVAFSEALSPKAGLAGLIGIEGLTRQQVDIKDNIARITFEDPGSRNDLIVYISGQVRTAGGVYLGEDHRYSLAPDELKPQVEIPLEGNILPDKKELVLPLRAVNLTAVDIKVVQIFQDNVLMFLQENDLAGNDEIRRAGRLVYSKQFRLDTDPTRNLHEWNEWGIDLSNLFKREVGAIYRVRVTFKKEYSLYGKPLPEGGALTKLSDGTPSQEELDEWDEPYSYYWESFYDWSEYDWEESDNPDHASYYMDSDRFPYVNVMSSSLGVIAKYASADKVWVTVNDIISAKPASGVAVEVYDFQLQRLATGKTDSQGLVELGVDHKPFLVVARRGDEASYLRLISGRENSLSRFEVGGAVLNRGIKGFVYGERGVWRPGDTLHVTLLVADRKGSLPQGHPAVMELYCPEGQFYTRKVEAGKDGFYTFHIPTSATDPTGYWNAYFKVGGTAVHKALHVETVKPNRLKVQLTPSVPVLKAGVNSQATVSANWLTGPAAAGLKAHAEMTLSNTGAPFKGFEGYVFRNPACSFSSSEHTLFETRLDAEGKSRINLSLPAAEEAPGMLTAFIVTSVEEDGGDESFTTMTMPYSPYKAYVGVKFPEGEYLETGKDHTIKVAVVDPEGKRVVGDPLSYTVYHISWSWWWNNSGESLDSYVNGSSPDIVASGALTSGNADATFTLRAENEQWGRYLVLVHDNKSGHTAGKLVTLDWSDYRGRAQRRDPDALNMLTFSLDKRSYQVGDKVVVYIPASSEGQALVSLENAAGVLSQAWVSTSADKESQYSFTVTPEMAPNFYVHISLVQPYGNVANDLPIRLYGVERVEVENPDSHLEPQIKMADTVAPEEPFTVQVSEKSGKPMTYTLAIVDEGLLDITAFKTPDPWAAMYKNEALGVKTWDLYDQIIGAYGARFSSMLGIGGDEAGVKNARRDNRFNPVVAFMGPFTLQKGTASHEVKLPMYVGSVRVMVVAGHAPAYGSAEKTVTVKAPLMVVPTLPRVLADGEKVTLPVNVFAMEDNIRSASVSIKVEGPARVEGADSESLSFEKAGDKMARFQLVATGEGTAKVTVTATGSGHKAYETVFLPINPANPETVQLTHQTLQKGKSAVLQAKGKATLELAGFPAVDAAGIYKSMKNYPYNCTEQMAAKGLSLLNLIPLLGEEEAADVKALIPGIVKELYARQSKDGGFVLWPGSKHSDSWVSSMAGAFLAQARDKGFEVSRSVLRSWEDYQKSLSKAFRLAGNAAFSDIDEAFRLYSLALAGEAQTGAMNRMKESPELDNRVKWMLAAAYAVAGKPQVAKELTAASSAEFEEYSTPVYYGSSLRDRAIALEVLVLTDQMAAAMPMANAVAERFNGGSWWSTQEAAFASVAMGKLYDKVGNQPFSVQVGSESISSPKSLYTMPVSGEVKVQNTSDNILYATLVDVFRAPAGTKVPERASGLKLSVAYTTPSGSPVNAAKLRQGTEFVATVTVTNTGADYVENLALSERIPSGWEIQNERLRGGVDNSSSAYKDIRDDRCDWFFGLGRGESKRFVLKLRAAYEGEFVLPAITCEAMYDHHIAANTASGIALVIR